MKKIYRYPIVILLVIGAVTAFFALQLPHLELDNNNFRFISSNDPARKVSEYIDDTFGSSLFILVGLRRADGDVFNASFLKRIREYVDRVEAIDIIDPVSSIVNAQYITGDGEAIIVEKLLPDDFAGTAEEITRLKERLLSWDMYKRALVSDDFSSTQILVPMNIPVDDAGKPEVVDSFIQVRDIAREMFADQAEVYVTGIPVISATVNESIRADLLLLVPLVTLVVLLILFFSFRRLSAVILPLLTVVIAVVWSMGAMSLFGIKLSVISTVLPVILIAVGSAYGIHVITHYIEDMGRARGQGRAPDREAHRDLVITLVKRLFKPLFLASLTTFVGFLSFCFTTVLPIREFGIFASFGVLASFAVAVTFMPALLIIRGPGCETKTPGADRISGAVAGFFSAIAMHKGAVLCTAVLILAVSITGFSRIIIDNIFVEYFKSDTDIYKSDRFIREYFGGSKIVSIVAEADSSEILLDPACLSAMDALNRYLEKKVPEVGKVMGFTDLVKRINQVFNADESPGGLQGPIASGTGEAAADSFDGGFDFDPAPEDDFGFGNFGIDDAQEFNFGIFEKDEAPFPEPEVPAGGIAIHTLEELTALLNTALQSGDRADPGVSDLLWELKRITNFEGAAYYEIPADPPRYGKSDPRELAALVSNYLILLSGEIDSYSNDPLEPTAIKTTVQLRTLGESDTSRALEEIDRFVQAHFPKNITVTVGGSALVEASLNRQVVRSQFISLIVSLFLVFLIISVSNRSLLAGCVGIIPLSISILLNFAVMGFLGIKLNIGTSMIASLAVGIGIDYTIHYMEAFKREYARHGIKASFAVSGKAIIINALSVGAGFGVLLFSRFNMLRDFGLLVALTMAASALVSLTLIPALLLTLKPKFIMDPWRLA
ncbi:MAG: MMPL family transporter [Spirochaetaceae bacterium]|jgi:predicted RND superfamily exporter protein|nr:MMPL family transporter [Spirochaetaceae bacterium]